MLWTVAFGLQAMSGPSDGKPRPRPTAPATCEEVSADEVVVCGARDQEGFRLRPLPQEFERDPTLLRAATTIGGIGVSAESEAGQAAGGGAPTRAMVRLKIPL